MESRRRQDDLRNALDSQLRRAATSSSPDLRQADLRQVQRTYIDNSPTMSQQEHSGRAWQEDSTSGRVGGRDTLVPQARAGRSSRAARGRGGDGVMDGYTASPNMTRFNTGRGRGGGEGGGRQQGVRRQGTRHPRTASNGSSARRTRTRRQQQGER